MLSSGAALGAAAQGGPRNVVVSSANGLRACGRAMEILKSGGDTLDAGQLADAEYAFYAPVYGTPDFTLRLQPGINLIAAIPLSKLPPDGD